MTPEAKTQSNQAQSKDQDIHAVTDAMRNMPEIHRQAAYWMVMGLQAAANIEPQSA